MLNGHKRSRNQGSRNGKRSAARVKIPAEVKQPTLREFWLEKYQFNVSKLRLPKAKARAWATRTVAVKREIAEMECHRSH